MSTTNNFKDTTIYGTFNNSNKTSTNAVAYATFEGDLNCNGEIVSKGSNINTLYQTKGSYVTPTSLSTTLTPYITSTSLSTTLSSYLTSLIASTTYQAKGNYLTTANLSPYSYSVQYTATLTYDGTLKIKPVAQKYTQYISIPSGVVKMDILLFGSGGFSGTTDFNVAPGVGGGGQIVCLRNVMITSGTLQLDIQVGTSGQTTNLIYGTTNIASAYNGNNGTDAIVTSNAAGVYSGTVGTSGLASITSPVSLINTSYCNDYSVKYGSAGTTPPAKVGDWSAPVVPYKGGYAGGNGGSAVAAWSATIGTSYAPGKIGGGMSNPIAYQSSPYNKTFKYDPSYKSGGAIITYYTL